ncbi:hypothetical protein [Pseudomonas sp. BN102]|uniref:hypothetical protein n=1 Tax=Pseudomonas sp. BN102 TaxID=2567886 RepID=UPI002457D565|nr:hypothetical protein [Pseudomonas sp. BN102]MDH4611358.1 hypothetical protein [Pseudomonas sp. BN102]
MGEDIPSPTDEQLQATLKDVFSSSDGEHPNAWLCLGQDAGPMFILDIYSSGLVVFGQWADPDYEEELAPESRLNGVSFEVASMLWQALRSGDLATIQKQPWL